MIYGWMLVWMDGWLDGWTAQMDEPIIRWTDG